MRLHRLAMTAALALLLVSCGDSTGPESFLGTYVLQSVAGQPLPYLLFQIGSNKSEVTAGSLRLNGDNTFDYSLTILVTDDSDAQQESGTVTGTWSATGASVILTSSDGTTRTGSKNGDTIVVVDNGVPWVFEK